MKEGFCSWKKIHKAAAASSLTMTVTLWGACELDKLINLRFS